MVIRMHSFKSTFLERKEIILYCVFILCCEIPSRNIFFGSKIWKKKCKWNCYHLKKTLGQFSSFQWICSKTITFGDRIPWVGFGFRWLVRRVPKFQDGSTQGSTLTCLACLSCGLPTHHGLAWRNHLRWCQPHGGKEDGLQQRMHVVVFDVGAVHNNWFRLRPALPTVSGQFTLCCCCRECRIYALFLSRMSWIRAFWGRILRRILAEILRNTQNFGRNSD